MDQRSVREEIFTNPGNSNSDGPVAKKRKVDFEDDISEVEVQLQCVSRYVK